MMVVVVDTGGVSGLEHLGHVMRSCTRKLMRLYKPSHSRHIHFSRSRGILVNAGAS